MTLEKFIKQRNPDWPAVTIRKNGSLCLNRKAIDEFNIGAMRFATLHYDQQEKLLGIKPETDTSDPSARRISKEKNRTSVIYCQAFLKHYDIPFTQRSNIHRARWDPRQQMILVKIA
jgi:hypothetical protein